MRIDDEHTADIEYDEDSDRFHGLIRSGPDLGPGDLVEFYGISPADLREQARISLEAHRAATGRPT